MASKAAAALRVDRSEPAMDAAAGRTTAAPDRKQQAAEIKAIAKELANGSNARAVHLVNLSLATYKWLLLNGESDDIKFQAATALLNLPPHQQKLEFMRETVQRPELDRKNLTRSALLGRRLKAVLDADPDRAAALLEALSEAEKQAGLPEIPRSLPRNSNGTKENR